MLGLGKIAKKVFGTPNDRRIREAQNIVESINALEKDFSVLSDSEISSKTKEFGHVTRGIPPFQSEVIVSEYFKEFLVLLLRKVTKEL